MKKWYKICPFCKNEIKKEAIKCQYCKEMIPEEKTEKKEWMMECPYCKNEIKKWAIKCQYCYEFLDKDKKVENEEINTKKDFKKDNITEKIIVDNYKKATRTKRFFATLIDLLINMTTIWYIYNLVIAFRKWETFWFNIMWIKFVQDDGNKLTGKQKFCRFMLYRPINFLIVWCVALILVYLTGIKIFAWFASLWIIVFIFNIIEWFFETPTFFEKKIGIRKIQYKKSRWWIVLVAVILLLLFAKFYSTYQHNQQEQHFQQYLNSPEFTEKVNKLKNRGTIDIVSEDWAVEAIEISDLSDTIEF